MRVAQVYVQEENPNGYALGILDEHGQALYNKRKPTRMRENQRVCVRNSQSING